MAELPDYLEVLSKEFDEFCQDRHAFGQEKYGPVKFMEIDSIQMALEEIADMTNYLRYTYIKLRMIQDYMGVKSVEVLEDVPNLGKDSFKKVTT